MPDESPRVFLSYGVRDASQIAERLHCDLAARGFEIWQDVKTPPARCKAARRFARARRNACSVGCTDHGTQDLIGAAEF
jgi:hypothetical protein